MFQTFSRNDLPGEKRKKKIQFEGVSIFIEGIFVQAHEDLQDDDDEDRLPAQQSDASAVSLKHARTSRAGPGCLLSSL